MSLINFLEVCKEESLNIFKEHSGNPVVTFIETDKNFDRSQNSWNSLIFIGGSKFNFMFQAEFTTIHLLSLASDRFSDVNETDYIDHVKDFMREFCNLFAGKLKACFETKTDAFLSLPIITREYDIEKIFDTPLDQLSSLSWKIGDGKMAISLKGYYHEKEKFGDYEFIQNHLKDRTKRSEIDFF